MAKQKIRIRLKAYDTPRDWIRSAEKIVETAKRSGADVSGPFRYQLRNQFTQSSVPCISIKIHVNNSNNVHTNV